ncbi:MAG: hypothetical protein P8N28_05615 [Phycisphaerales bacterium]|nr:hypothetical protein [Phycisphaerales bacterium]
MLKERTSRVHSTQKNTSAIAGVFSIINHLNVAAEAKQVQKKNDTAIASEKCMIYCKDKSRSCASVAEEKKNI